MTLYRITVVAVLLAALLIGIELSDNWHGCEAYGNITKRHQSSACLNVVTVFEHDGYSMFADAYLALKPYEPRIQLEFQRFVLDLDTHQVYTPELGYVLRGNAFDAGGTKDYMSLMDASWVYLMTGDHSKAMLCALSATRLSGTDPLPLITLGLFAESSGRMSDCVTAYSSAIERDPAVLGSPFFTDFSRRNPEAAQLVTKIALLDQAQQERDPLSRSRAARISLYRGDVQGARRFAMDALRALPNLPGAWLTLAEADSSDSRNAGAYLCLQRALWLNPKDVSTSWLLSQDRVRAGDLRAALAYARLAKENRKQAFTQHANEVGLLYNRPTAIKNDVFPAPLFFYTQSGPSDEDIKALIATLQSL